MSVKTYEPQYQDYLNRERASLGLMTNQVWEDDPRRLLFTLARYKFVSKMLAGKSQTIEIGCGDAFCTRLVQQEVRDVTVLDIDPVFIEDVKCRMSEKWPMNTIVHDFMTGPLSTEFETAYSLDVLEHIDIKDEDTFWQNIAHSIKEDGILIVGTPSIHSQKYASKASIEGHINCKDANQLKTLMNKFFKEVFIFSMNDEVVHTGFSPMAHYFFAICSGRK